MKVNIAMFWKTFFQAYHTAPRRHYKIYLDFCRYHDEEDIVPIIEEVKSEREVKELRSR